MNISAYEWIQILSILPTVVQTVENTFSSIKGKTGPQKLQAATNIVLAAVPSVAASLVNQPKDITHIQSVINSVVAANNAAAAVAASASQATDPATP
jgi:hypothetical protein